MAHLAVQIEHRDLVPVVEIERNAEGSVDLTTMRREQRKAVVDVFLTDGSRREKAASFVIPSLPQVQGRKPLIQLTGSVEGKTAHLRLFVERRLVDTQTVDVRSALPRKALLPALLVVLLILLLGGGAYFLFFRGTTDPPVASRSEPASSESSRQPGTEESGAGESGAGGPQLTESEAGSGGAREPGSTDRAGSEEGSAAASGSATAMEADTATPGTPEPASEVAPESAASAEPSYSVYFRPNSAVLTPAAQEELRRVGQALARQEVSALRIVGHTALAGTEAGRIELSWDRARAVQAFLSEGGSEAADQAQILGRGGDAPLTRERELQHLNRRVEIYVGD